MAENQTIGIRNDGFVDNSGDPTLSENSVYHDHVLESNITNSIGREIGSGVVAVENQVHDANLMAMDRVVMPRVETAVISNIRSSGRRPKGIVQNPDQSDFS